MLNLGPTWIWAIVLVLGVLGMLFKNKFSTMLGQTGSVLGLNAKTTLLVLTVVAVLAGGFGVVASLASGAGVASIGDFGTDDAGVAGATIGGISLKLHDGLSNATTSEDTIDSTDKFMIIYSADANVEDQDAEYLFNVTIQRELIAEDANVKVICTAPDKEIDGVTLKNLVEKTAGKIDLDINDGGTHSDKVTVWKNIAFSEGTGSANIQVAFDHEEAYHDGMTDLQDYVDITCDFVPSDGSSSDSTLVRIYANS